ncbi:AI-2E family transporter [uncultured Arcticibacterium sp.]|uniref:AI-2E family transporter n=1 Tax=uncultured Arcticibacterium sp. TaxID=2173042 RepID=UPI0030F89399
MKLKLRDLPSVLILCTLLVIVLIYLKSILVPIVIAILLSVAVQPIVTFITSKGINKSLSSIIGIFVVLTVFCSLGYLFINQLGNISENQEKIMNKMSHYNNIIISELNESKMGKRLVNVYKRQVTTEEYIKTIFENSSSSLNTSLDIIINILLVPIYMFFFLSYSKFFLGALSKIVAPFNKLDFRAMIKSSKKVLQSYFTGFAKVVGILAVLNSVGLLFLGVEDAIFYGVLAALLSVIPYVGVIVGSLLPALMALVNHDSALNAMGVVGWMTFVQFLEGNFITPNVVGNQIRINPFVVLVFLLIFSKIWGLAGLIVAIPIAAIFKEVCRHVETLNPIWLLMTSFPAAGEKQPSIQEIKTSQA